jgi:hypothetical protein
MGTKKKASTKTQKGTGNAKGVLRALHGNKYILPA